MRLFGYWRDRLRACHHHDPQDCPSCEAVRTEAFAAGRRVSQQIIESWQRFTAAAPIDAWTETNVWPGQVGGRLDDEAAAANRAGLIRWVGGTLHAPPRGRWVITYPDGPNTGTPHMVWVPEEGD